MATDPSQLINYLATAGGLAGANAQQGRQLVLQEQAQKVQNGLLQLRFQQAQAEQAQQQQYQSDVSSYFANPTPQGLAALVGKYPEQAQALKQSYDVMDAPAKESRLVRYGSLYNLAKTGNAQGASKLLDSIISAEQARGIDTSDFTSIRDALANGDKSALPQIQALAQAHLAAGNPEFAKAIGIDDNSNHFSTAGEGAIYDQRTGQITAYARRDPKTVTVKNADGSESIVQLGGGGDPASVGGAGGSSAPAGRTFGGWTPRARNGGDNSDLVVDNKISGMSAALGISPTTVFPASMSNLDIAKALTLSEGGSGTLADRNNNPANLTDPKTGGYRKFATKEAGLAAAAAQVARNRARGQNTIQSMVEGLPAGGGRSSDANVIYTSKGGPAGGDATLDDQTVSMMAQQYLAGDPSVMTNLGRGKQGAANIVKLREAIASQARNSGMNGAQIAATMQDFKTHQQALNAFARGPEARTVRSLNVTIDHLDTLQNAAQALQNGNIGIFNKVRQSWARATGSPIPTNFEGVRQIVSAEVAKAITGGNTALADRQDLAHSISTANSPQQLAGYIAEVKQLMAGQLEGLAGQYKAGTGRNDFSDRLSERTKHALGYRSAASPGSGWGKAQVVR